MANVSRLATPLPKEPSNQSQWRFEPLNTPTEWIESYRPGGLHPIHPGDTLCNGRYTVVCKLGYGAFSTVWLAEDGQQSTLVAIKVARADARQVLEELRLYKRLAQTDANRNHVVLPLDGFQQPGPDGLHQCLVFEPMGPSVGLLLAGIPDPPEDMASFDEPPPPPPAPTSAAETPSTTQITLGRRKALLKQLLLGLDCLHSGAVAHGDLNPGNFLLAIRQFSSEDVRNIRTSCESSGRSGPVRRIDGEQDLWAPRYLYLDHPLVHYVDMEHKVSAKLSDPGAAFTFDKPPIANRCVTPAALRAPEIVLKNDIDHKIDIWSFGCLLYEFFTGNVLFQVSGLTEIPQEENDDDHLLQIIDILGQPPPEIFAKWPRRARYFDEDLQLIRSDVSSSDVAEGEPFRGPSLEEAFEESRPDGMEASECAHVIGLLRSLLQYKPDMRPSTAELLDDEWFQSIGT